jgi:hypothetical protein
MKSRPILKKDEIDAVIDGTQVCHVAMVDPEDGPYVLPFNFGYHNSKLFIHSGPEGKKIKIWERDSRVCVAFSTGYEMRIQNPEVACSYSMRYRSLLLYGKVKQIFDRQEKEQILNIVMEKYTGRRDFTYSTPALDNVSVFEIDIEKVEGRAYGY